MSQIDMYKIEQTIETLNEDEITQQTEVYKNKLEAVGEKVHHKAKLSSLIRQWKEYEAKNEMKGASSFMARREKQRKEQLKLIRVRITCHNPAKNKLTGEYFTVGNSLLGFHKKLIPFNCEAAESYHIPLFMLNTLKERKYVVRTSRTRKEGGMNQMYVDTHETAEFSFEVLPPLTKEELTHLAKKQAMAKGVEVD